MTIPGIMTKSIFMDSLSTYELACGCMDDETKGRFIAHVVEGLKAQGALLVRRVGPCRLAPGTRRTPRS